MRVFFCIDHDTHWPVGGASVVAAHDEDGARLLLDKELQEAGLAPSTKHEYTLRELPLSMPRAVVLRDGDY